MFSTFATATAAVTTVLAEAPTFPTLDALDAGSREALERRAADRGTTLEAEHAAAAAQAAASRNTALVTLGKAEPDPDNPEALAIRTAGLVRNGR